jgi:hypothetical protein
MGKHFIYILFFILIYNVFQFALPVKILTQQQIDKFYILDSNIVHTGSDASIQKVTDGSNIYILKQIHNESMNEQFLLINDAIASTIGYDAGIHVNEVFFIPYTNAKHIKIYPDRAATLHSYISGKDLEQELPVYLTDDFIIHQRIINVESIWQKRWPLHEHQQGFTQIILENMSLHEDLPPIVALDTFLGNSDRSLPNIIYNKSNNHFYGIDQAAVFGNNLAAIAHKRLKELLETDFLLTSDSKIINSLQEYQKALLHLREKNIPSAIIQNMQELLPYLGPNSLQNDLIDRRIKHETRIINNSYESILELILLIDQIISRS